MADYLKVAYLNSGGSFCFYCKSSDIATDGTEIDSGSAVIDIYCRDCQRGWKEVYNLVDVILEEDEI